jgi:hypothetical protein
MSTMIAELNSKFALKLDLHPRTTRTKLAEKEHDEKKNIVLIGGSHAGKLAGHLEALGVNVIDLSSPGFRITDASVEAMATDLETALSDLDDKSTVVIIQPFDNSVYFSSKARGEKVLTRKGKDKKYHVEGDLRMIGKDDFKNLFLEILPLIRVAKGKRVILMSPMPRYAFNKCCPSASHGTNIGGQEYVEELLKTLKEIHSWLNSNIYMRKMKQIKLFNTAAATGISSEGLARQADRWGPDPVHPQEEVYFDIADKIGKMADEFLSAGSGLGPGVARGHTGKREREHDSWITSSEPVAKQQYSGTGFVRGGRGRGGGGPRPYSRQHYPGKRDHRQESHHNPRGSGSGFAGKTGEIDGYAGYSYRGRGGFNRGKNYGRPRGGRW